MEALAERVCASDADVLLLAGDVGSGVIDDFPRCLALFSGFAGTRLLVPGNHDLWTNDGDSEEIYRETLPALSAEAGFHMLDTGPFVTGRTAFIGNIGWYDYSFRDLALGFDIADYRRKYRRGVGRYNDGVFVQWGRDDAEFTEICLARLREDYERVAGRVDRCVVLLHHLPFAELLYESDNPSHRFCLAFMGSERFGELLTEMPKARLCVSGHRHGRAVCRKGGLDAYVVGSEYGLKRLLEIDLAAGTHEFHEFRPPL